MAEIKKTLGGDRIGSGKKMQVELDGYVRSNHDLSMVWRSSQAPGTVVPCYCNIAQKGDTWNFDLSSIVRTKPTTGPLYGSFKFEILFFAADIRLYNGALHNNALNLGMEMKNVIYPKIQIPVLPNPRQASELGLANDIQLQNMNPSALMAYLGVTNPGNYAGAGTYSFRYFNGMPVLMYWDVIKNYLINKQEKNAWYIGVKVSGGENTEYWNRFYQGTIRRTASGGSIAMTVYDAVTGKTDSGALSKSDGSFISINAEPASGNNPGEGSITLIFNVKPSDFDVNLLKANITTIQDGQSKIGIPFTWLGDITTENVEISGQTMVKVVLTAKASVIESHNGQDGFQLSWFKPVTNQTAIQLNAVYSDTKTISSVGPIEKMQLRSFPIENLDKARGVILKNFFEGENVTITGKNRSIPKDSLINFEPYSELCEVATDSNGKITTKNSYTQNGLAIKTYLNDIFNAFLDSETIEQINRQTAASVSNGQLSISTLILAEKIYKLQNKIAVAGGTYEDWQEAVYGIATAPANESPRFIGGASSEIVFDEVVSSSATEVGGEVSPLGALGGRGSLGGWRGGKFELEVKEDCLIMGLCCITPRIDYSQGNKWFMNLQNNDQLHKPELDRIGFQNLMGDWMCGSDTAVEETSGWGIQKAYAMQPAWEHYMTAVNEAHGDFADARQAMYMTLNRSYEVEADTDGVISIADFTSYIDPTKYNNAFADTTIESQNFWTQIGMDIKVRRVMSNKIMPNL